MSYSITGIQSITASLPFSGSDHASSGVAHSQNTKATADQGDTVNLSTPDKVKVASSSSASTPHAFGVQPAKPVSVPEPVDTVTLSTSDKVRTLRQEGEGDTQIATTLSLPLKEVQSDLHLETQAHFSFTVAPVTSAFTSNTATAVSASA